MNKLAEQLTALADELKSSNWFITLNIERHSDVIRVHMREEGFTNIFNDFDFKDLDHKDFPTEIYKDIDGVHFFALSKEPAIFCEGCGTWLTKDKQSSWIGFCQACDTKADRDDRDMDDNKFFYKE